MDSSSCFKVVCDSCDAKLASVFCHSDGAFLCPQCDAQVHSVNKLAQRHMRVPCQSCPVWAYREAKSRGRLLDMPLAACLTRNMQMDIFDGTGPTPGWPANQSSAALTSTPHSDASSPQPTAAPAPENAGSPGSPVPASALYQKASSWPQNSMLAISSQPQPCVPQQSIGDRPMSPYGEPDTATAAGRHAASPFSGCSWDIHGAASTAQPRAQGPDRWSLQDGQSMLAPASAAVHQAEPSQVSQQSQHSLQRVKSQELMDAVDSMDVAMLLDTFCAPLDQLQEQRKSSSSQVTTLHDQQQAQQQQLQMQQQQVVVHQAHQQFQQHAPMNGPPRQMPAMRTMSGMSCLSQTGVSNSNAESMLASGRSSSALLFPSLEQHLASSNAPMTLAGAAGTGWADMPSSAQRQLQQLKQQQQAAMQALHQQQAAVVGAAQQHQQAQMQQLLQRSFTDELPRTSPINIGSGSTAAGTLAAAAARRDAALRAGLGLGVVLSDPGYGRGRSLASSLPQPAANASTSCLQDGLSGLSMDGPMAAAAAAPNIMPAAPPGASPASPLPAAGVAVPGATRPLDASVSSFSGAAALPGSGGSSSVSPSNCTLAGASTEREGPFALAAQHAFLPGSAPPALGLNSSLGLASAGGSCELSDGQLVRMSSEGYRDCGVMHGSAGSVGTLAMSAGDADAMGAALQEWPDSLYRELDPERVAQLSRYKHKRMLRMRARKQVPDARQRFKGRIAKVSSSEGLNEFCAAAAAMPAAGGLVATTSENAAGAAAMRSWAYGNGMGLGGAHHMQRIDEEATQEGSSGLQQAGQAALMSRTTSSVLACSQAAQLQQLRRAQSSGVLEGVRVGGGGAAGQAAHGPGPACHGSALAAPTQDCVITEHDLAALGFDDLPQFSGGLMNGHEDMDESAESLNDGRAKRPAKSQPMTYQRPLMSVQAQCVSAHAQVPVVRPGPPARPSVLDRPIMYGTDRSQFSAAQLSLLDSILADQYRPTGGR
ncbi:Zinc finger protein CONSTANS [Tetrabaena socialis]|uniref:Zinc finger protein CONSTANS n=1 Tax=Tetrabaena socialis TaxID=47790 RepID=A0A2J8AIU0_9CHLO|nr:Zinc finger protein CONSTANS [Tetrabaena socialis]|eukprot:PNH12431.1 Zinc finger protein CONSTANS [Tetrabaena socialis]